MMYNLVIADDEQLVPRFICAVIEKNQLPLHVCGTAQNGVDALNLVETYRPEIVLLDINMPRMNGLEAAEKIHEVYPDTVIYILTAYKEFDYVHRAIHAQVADYLVKPIKPDDLVQALKKGIDRVSKMYNDSTSPAHEGQQLKEPYPAAIRDQMSELLRLKATDEEIQPLLCRL